MSCTKNVENSRLIFWDCSGIHSRTLDGLLYRNVWCINLRFVKLGAVSIGEIEVTLSATNVALFCICIKGSDWGRLLLSK
jgi:hypothetical protein